MTIWRMRTAHRIPKNKYTPTECVILIDFLPQRVFHERASVSRYTDIAILLYVLNRHTLNMVRHKNLRSVSSVLTL
jgi:hypothetical protein